jgi:hypothetical protein
MNSPVCDNLFSNIELASILKTPSSSANICVIGDCVAIMVVYISPKLPSVENIDLYKNVSMWQHATSVAVLSELRSPETFGGKCSRVLISYVGFMHVFMHAFVGGMCTKWMRIGLVIFVCLFLLWSPCFNWRTTGRTSIKFGMDIMPFRGCPKFVLFYFLESVIPTWRMHELTRWDTR